MGRMLLTVLELATIIVVVMVVVKEIVIPMWNNTAVFPSLRKAFGDKDAE